MKQLSLLLAISILICFAGCKTDESLAELKEGEYYMYFSSVQILSAHDELDSTYQPTPQPYYLKKVADHSFDIHYFVRTNTGVNLFPCVVGNVTTKNTQVVFTPFQPIQARLDSCYINQQSDTGSVHFISAKFNKQGGVEGTCYAYLLFRKPNFEYIYYKCKTDFLLKQ